ncbi:serum response factor-binding protein [Aliiglaciecola lipolytica]|nr:serum response factor-binding protein [Aliiglaciecola lipolytica]
MNFQNVINANKWDSTMLNNDLLQVTNTPNQAAKPAENGSDQNDDGCRNKEKFEDSLEQALKAFSTSKDE